MMLKYYILDNKKIYTLKDKIDGKKTLDAHYKFIRIRSISDNAEAQNA